MMQRIIISIVLLFFANSSIADEIRPGYLELNEDSPNTYSILWKVPKKSGQALSLEPHFPEKYHDNRQATISMMNIIVATTCDTW